jgi:hypothetical protein
MLSAWVMTGSALHMAYVIDCLVSVWSIAAFLSARIIEDLRTTELRFESHLNGHVFIWGAIEFRRVRIVAKSARCFVVSSCLYERAFPTGRIPIEFGIGHFRENLPRNFKFD